MNPQCNMTEQEREAALVQFNGILNPDEEDIIRQLFPQYLFFRFEYDCTGYGERPPVRVCTCTACGASFEAVSANYARGKVHNEPVTCPYCYSRLTGKEVTKYSYSMSSLCSWIKTAVARPGENGTLLIEAGKAKQSFSWDNLTGTIDWFPKARYVFSKGKAQMWKWNVEYSCSGFGISSGRWVAHKTISDPFAPNLMEASDYAGDYSIIGLASALPQTDSRYSQILEYYRYNYAAALEEYETARWMVKYLGWYSFHPQIEMAVKLELVEAVTDLVQNGKKNSRIINWDANNPAAFLRMNKQEARKFIHKKMDMQDLRQWRELCKGTPFSDYCRLLDTCGSRALLRDVAECVKIAGVKLVRGVNYVNGFMSQCSHGLVPLETVVRTWKDYLNMAQQLDYDLREITVSMPKDLKQRHDNAAALIRYRKSADEQKKYGKRKKKLEKEFAFEMGDLCICVPQSSEDIVQEGKTLQHCVGSYADRHMRGVLTILFLRKRRTPKRSFLTIELKEERGKIGIRQIHGYMNENYSKPGHAVPSPREVYRTFLDCWLEWVNAGSQRDKQGRPILPEPQKEKAV